MTEKRDNSGALFKNDRKEQDNHPDYTGQGMFEGKEFWINAWLKEGPKGKYFSFSFKPKEARRPATKQPAFEDRLADDVIPF